MRSHKFFTVFLLSAITIMISVAFIFWGIGPKDNPTIAFVAHIEGERITLDEFWRAYDNEFKRLREQYPNPEDIEKLNLEDRVLGSLVDRIVLIIAAREAGITVSETELQEVIINTVYFQRDGVFDQNVYNRALKLNRLTPQTYEDNLKSDLIIAKMSRLIGETAELTSEELKILDSIKSDNKDQLAEAFRSSKSNQAVRAYVEGFKRQLDVKINRDLIS